MKNICIALFVILLLQSTKAGDSIGATTTTVSLISGSDYCSAFVYKCVADGKQDDGVASPNTASADGITFTWTLTVDGTPVTLTKDSNYWVKSDATFTSTTATSYIILKPGLFSSTTKGANVLTCTQAQTVNSVGVTTASSSTASLSAKNDVNLTVTKADATCVAAPVLTLTESSDCSTIKAFIKDGVAADDKMYVLGTDAAVLDSATLAISKTYTVVAIKKNVVANTVTTVTLGASNNCLITTADVSQKTDPCNVQVISFEYASVASSTVSAAVSKTVSSTTTPITDTTKYFVQEVTGANGKTKQVVVVQSKTFAASDVANISLGYLKDNILRLGSKSVTMGSQVQSSCDSTAMTSSFSNDCQTQTITASTATATWVYYGTDSVTVPSTSVNTFNITKKGIYIADLSTTGNTPVIKQEYIQVTDTDCVKVTKDAATTSTDRCAAMSFTCVTNITTPTFAWTNAPSTATLSSTVNAAALTIAANIFTSTDNATQTLTCTVNSTKSADLPITLVSTACSSGNGNGSGSGDDDDDDSSSILSILALLLVALLL